MRIAFFASVDRDSRARYVLEELIPILEQEHVIEIFSDQADELICNHLTRSFLTAHLCDRDNQYDAAIHLYEDGTQRRAARFGVAIIPGICWFLDYTPQQDMPLPLLDSPWLSTVHQLTGKGAAWSRAKGQNRPYGPHAFRESSISPATIFCDTWSYKQFTEHLNKVPSLGGAEHSHLLQVPVSTPIHIKERQHDALIFGGAGVEDNLLVALHAVRRATANFRVFCAKEDYPRVLLKVQELSASPECIVVHDAKQSMALHWRNLCTQSRAVLLPRYSAYGTISPYKELALAHSEIVLLPHYFRHQDLPENVLYFYEAGIRSGDEIYEVLAAKASATEEARRYCLTLAPKNCASRLMQIVESERAHIALVKARKSALLVDAQRALFSDAQDYLSGTDSLLVSERRQWGAELLREIAPHP